MVGDRALIEGGLTKEEHERLRDLLRSGAPQFGEELNNGVKRLREILSTADAFNVLSHFIAANNFAFWGEYFEPTAEGSEAKTEFLAAILVTTAGTETGDRADADLIQEIIDCVDGVFDAASLLNLSKAVGQDDALAEIRFTSKGQWLSLRGASYEHHARDLAHEIYDDLADEMRQRLGFNLADVIAVEAAAVGLMEERFNALTQEAGQVAARVGADAAFLAEAKETDPTVTNEVLGQWAFLQSWEGGLTDALTLRRSDLADATPDVPEEALTVLLSHLSIELGSLPEGQYVSPLGPNPLTDRPFIASGAKYLLPVPGMIAREFPTLIERDMLANFKRFSYRRARVLDRLAVRYVADMVKAQTRHVGLFYNVVEEGQVKTVECDGLVLVDCIAIVVEGKATPLSPQARSGDVTRARRDLTRAIEEAARQGDRARRYLLSDGDAIFLDEDGDEVLRVPSGSIDQVLVLNPTLHEMGAFSLHPSRLDALGLAGTQDLWSIYINDLRIIADVVQDPAEFLHYWTWRTRLPMGTRVHAVDEIDLFGAYLLREQFLELEESPSSVVSVSGSSADFDDYYLWQTGHGPRAKKPEMFQVAPVKRFIQHLSRTKPKGWLSAAGVCLDLSLAELAFVDVELRRLRPGEVGWVEWGSFDRCTLLLLGPTVSWVAAWESFRERGQYSKRILFAGMKNGRARLVWALDTSMD